MIPVIVHNPITMKSLVAPRSCVYPLELACISYLLEYPSSIKNIKITLFIKLILFKSVWKIKPLHFYLIGFVSLVVGLEIPLFIGGGIKTSLVCRILHLELVGWFWGVVSSLLVNSVLSTWKWWIIPLIRLFAAYTQFIFLTNRLQFCILLLIQIIIC